MPKCAMIVGHTQRSQGAYSETLNMAEYPWNKDLAMRFLQMWGPLTVRVFYRDGIGVSGAYKQADQWGADVAVELHFNSSADPSASGTETLYISDEGRKLASAIQPRMVAALGLRDRGVKRPWQGRGEASLTAISAPTVILEPFFGSNPGDALRAREHKQELAKAIYGGLCTYFGLEWPRSGPLDGEDGDLDAGVPVS